MSNNHDHEHDLSMSNNHDHEHDLLTINKPAGIDLRSPAGLERVEELFESQNISPDVPPDLSLESFGLRGGVTTLLTDGEDTLDQYTVFDYLLPPGGGPPPHIHNNEDEAFYILDGEVSFQVGNQTFVGTPGDLVAYTGEEVHAFRNMGTEPARMLVLTAPAGIEDLLRQTSQPVEDISNVPPDDIPKFTELAPEFGLEIYPETVLFGKPPIEDGGISLYGDERSATLIGTEGSDLIIGRNGDDLFFGEQGNDTLIGGNGQDLIYGGEGDDLLSGYQANDTLVGGAGSDIFVLTPGGGTEIITDFTNHEDLIQLPFGVAFEDLAISQGSEVNANDTFLSLANNDELLATVTGVEADIFSSSDFIVV